MPRDPVCGMNATSETAAGKYEYKGETYYFCSTHCLEAFKKDPEKYIGAKPAPQQDVGARRAVRKHDDECKDDFFCPMHPEETSKKPSSCKK